MKKRHKAGGNLRNLLSDPLKQKSQADNALAALFRDIMAQHGVEIAEWETRVENYFRRVFTRNSDIDVQKVNQAKSNLQRALARSTLTWGRFETALQVMGSETYTIEVSLNYKNGKTFRHSVKVKNRACNVTDAPPERISLQNVVDNWKNEDDDDSELEGYQPGLFDEEDGDE